MALHPAPQGVGAAGGTGLGDLARSPDPDRALAKYWSNSGQTLVRGGDGGPDGLASPGERSALVRVDRYLTSV